MFASVRRAMLFVMLPFIAHAAGSGITIIHLDFAAMPGVAAAYPTVTAATDDALVSARSEWCAAIELHTHRMDGNVMRMRKVDRVPLAAGTPVVFAPGGLHLMFIGPKKPFMAGDTVPVTFTFEHAPEQTVRFHAVLPQALHDHGDSPKPTHQHE